MSAGQKQRRILDVTAVLRERIAAAGPRYRNLFARGGCIYYVRKVGARRFKRTLETSSWEEAAARRDAYEQAKGIGRRAFVSGDSPRLADSAKRYLD